MYFATGVKKGVFSVTNMEFEPETLISDASPPIQNAFYHTFESAKNNVVCWAHVKRNLYQKVNNEKVLDDVDTLQLSPNIDVFERGVELFMDKWGVAEKKFCDYFKKVWLQRNFSWFEGYKILIPSHFNHLEAYNNVLKRKYTLRRRLSIIKFNVQLFKCFGDMSSSYNQNRSYALTATIPVEAWSKAIVWAKDKKCNAVYGEVLNDFQEICVPSAAFVTKTKRKLLASDVTDFKRYTPEHFDDFYENPRGFEA